MSKLRQQLRLLRPPNTLFSIFIKKIKYLFFIKRQVYIVHEFIKVFVCIQSCLYNMLDFGVIVQYSLEQLLCNSLLETDTGSLSYIASPLFQQFSCVLTVTSYLENYINHNWSQCLSGATLNCTKKPLFKYLQSFQQLNTLKRKDVTGFYLIFFFFLPAWQ